MREQNAKKIRGLSFSWANTCSGISDSLNVRKITMEKKADELFHIQNIRKGDWVVNFVLFAKLGSNHPSAQLWLESQTDLSASIYSMLGGYYRQALICLRNWLELTAIGIYYSSYCNDQTSRYNQWIRGQRQSPSWKHLMEALLARSEFEAADKKVRLNEKLEKLYYDLSEYVHNKGMANHDLKNNEYNTIIYIEEAFDTYYRVVPKVFDAVMLLLFTAYTKELTYTINEEFDQIEGLLSYETKQYIQSLYTNTKIKITLPKKSSDESV